MSDDRDTFTVERTAKHAADLHYLINEQLAPELTDRDITASGRRKELDPPVRLRVTVEVERLDDTDTDTGDDC